MSNPVDIQKDNIIFLHIDGVSFQQYSEHIPVPSVDRELCNSPTHYNGHLGSSDLCTGSRTDRPICKVCIL